MTPKLAIAIEKLYQVFSAYPLRNAIIGCPCCVSDAQQEKLHSKLLRELDEEDLSRYAFKSMTTWGDSEDFRHFLPRIFELMANTGFIVETFIVLGKLSYGKWKEWPQDEQQVVIEFLLAWWDSLIKQKPYFDKEAFVAIYKLIEDIDLLLSIWTISFENNTFNNYVALIYDEYANLTLNEHNFKELDENATIKLTNWIESNALMLERGFYHYAESNPELAERISQADFIFKSIKKMCDADQ